LRAKQDMLHRQVHFLTVVLIAPDRPAANANGTVNPSDIPITMSLTVSDPVKCRSMCGVCGMRVSPVMWI
jgi:hypothetical protein